MCNTIALKNTICKMYTMICFCVPECDPTRRFVVDRESMEKRQLKETYVLVLERRMWYDM